MTCKLINDKLDDYVAGELTAEEQALGAAHVESCGTCRQLVDDQQALVARLQDYGASNVAVPDADFFDRAIAKAASQGNKRDRNRWIMTGFGGAMAAALALWMIGGMFFNTPEMIDTDIPGVTMALEEPTTLNLVFSSAEALANATMTVMLPIGIEVKGFKGQREITWMTSLKEGRNVLPLTLVATTPHGGEVLATLQHEGDDRSFKLQVTVNEI